jgi:hypothetical protein
MLIRRFKFEIGIICQQFYVMDESTEYDPDWTTEAGVRLLAKNTGILGIGTVRTDAYVRVILEITSAKPKDDDFDAWDQVNECSLSIASGKLIVTGIGDELSQVPRIHVRPGSYRCRIYYGNLASVSTDKLEGNDHYKLVLWKSAPSRLIVRKQYIKGSRNEQHTRPQGAQRPIMLALGDAFKRS